MEKNEFAVLAELRKNSRAHFSAISRQTGIPLSTVCEIAARLQSLRRDTALLRLENASFPIRAFLAVSARSGSKEALHDMLLRSPHVNTASLLQGDFDFFIDAVFRNFMSMQEFLEQIEALASKKKVYYVTGAPKIEGMLSKKSDYALFIRA